MGQLYLRLWCTVNILLRFVRLVTSEPTRMLFFLMGYYKCVWIESRVGFLSAGLVKRKALYVRKKELNPIAWQKGDSRNKGRERSHQDFALGKVSWFFATVWVVGAVSNEEHHHCLPPGSRTCCAGRWGNSAVPRVANSTASECKYS